MDEKGNLTPKAFSSDSANEMVVGNIFRGKVASMFQISSFQLPVLLMSCHFSTKLLPFPQAYCICLVYYRNGISVDVFGELQIQAKILWIYLFQHKRRLDIYGH